MNYLKYLNDHFIDSHMLTDVIISVGMIGIAISIFFFTYAATIEQKIVVTQTNIVINDLMQTIKPLLTEEQKQNFIKNLNTPDNRQADLDALNSNNELISNAYTILLVILIVSLGLGLLSSIIYKHNYYYLIGLNGGLLMFVILTEYSFLHFIPEKYMIADTNWVRWKILRDVKEKIKD